LDERHAVAVHGLFDVYASSMSSFAGLDVFPEFDGFQHRVKVLRAPSTPADIPTTFKAVPVRHSIAID
jgi:hypothetical protein